MAPGGILKEIYGGRERIDVNSLHGQAIDRVAPGLSIEAQADDGTIEAVSTTDRLSFVLGVQWHPEWRACQIEDHQKLFESFGGACRTYHQSKGVYERPRDVA